MTVTLLPGYCIKTHTKSYCKLKFLLCRLTFAVSIRCNFICGLSDVIIKTFIHSFILYGKQNQLLFKTRLNSRVPEIPEEENYCAVLVSSIVSTAGLAGDPDLTSACLCQHATAVTELHATEVCRLHRCSVLA